MHTLLGIKQLYSVWVAEAASFRGDSESNRSRSNSSSFGILLSQIFNYFQLCTVRTQLFDTELRAKLMFTKLLLALVAPIRSHAKTGVKGGGGEKETERKRETDRKD